MADLATACVTDLQTKIKAIGSEIKDDNILMVVSEEDFSDQSTMLKPPFAGVMYVGMRNNGADSSRQGLAVDLTVAIVLAFPAVANYDYKGEAWKLLSDLRTSIRTTRSPSGHKWRFTSEAFLGTLVQKNGKLGFFSQVWTTMAAISSG